MSENKRDIFIEGEAGEIWGYDYFDNVDKKYKRIRAARYGLVIDVIYEGTVISQLQYYTEPEMVAVGQKGYYLLDKSKDIIIIVNFDSENIAEKKIPEDVNSVFCRNGYVFLGKYSQKYLDQIIADYFSQRIILLWIYKSLPRNI